MRTILAALTALLALLAVSLLAVSLTPATVIVAMVLLGAAGMLACFALFTETDETPAAADANEVLVADADELADFDGTAHLLDMMEATAATINPDDVDLFIYRPALNGGTRWAATLHDTYNDVITTVTGSTQTPGTVNVINVYRETGTTDCFKNVSALKVAQELEADLPHIAANV